ncbi:MAG: hypothetical protein LBS19_09385 [Clostridiales bacterium]|jgi:hypothetical protein|nr:hypothetical protein [Clostridiales bacterium]
MSQKIDALLRTILYQAMKAEDKEEIVRAVRVMCNKDMIAAVEKEVAEQKAGIDKQ